MLHDVLQAGAQHGSGSMHTQCALEPIDNYMSPLAASTTMRRAAELQYMLVHDAAQMNIVSLLQIC